MALALEVVEAIIALTKSNGEGRLAAAQRAADNAIARNVKLADVTDNMNIGRISQPTEKDHARVQEYEQVRALLLSCGASLAAAGPAAPHGG